MVSSSRIVGYICLRTAPFGITCDALVPTLPFHGFRFRGLLLDALYTAIGILDYVDPAASQHEGIRPLFLLQDPAGVSSLLKPLSLRWVGGYAQNFRDIFPPLSSRRLPRLPEDFLFTYSLGKLTMQFFPTPIPG